MIEFSIGELVCFCAAVLATGKWFYWKGEARRHLTFVRLLIEDKTVREKVVSDFESFKRDQAREATRNT